MKKSIKSSSPAYVKPTVIRPAIPINIRRPLSLQNKDEDSVDGSPPMPSVPPPPPPPEALEVLAHGPPIPPRPNKKFVSYSIFQNYVIIHYFISSPLPLV